MPKVSSVQGTTFGTKQCSVIVPGGTLIADFLLPVQDFSNESAKIEATLKSGLPRPILRKLLFLGEYG